MASAQEVINHAQRDNKRIFPYIWRGRLNTVCRRENRESTPIAIDNDEWVLNPEITRGVSLDRADFTQTVHFKVTLDFKETKETLNLLECEQAGLSQYNVRETTDWILLTCPGARAFYDRNMKKLVLLECRPSVSVTHDFVKPVTIILGYDDGQWIAERVFGH